MDGKNGTKDATILGGFFHLNSHGFESYRVSGDKTEARRKQLHAMHMFSKPPRQQSRLYDAVYGEERPTD